MVVGVVFVILFTVAFGRIFCGWICPQTIFMEMVFRRIEYWIDGDRGKQIRLSKMPWNAEKIKKRVLKWIVFFIISFLIANIFLAYLIGSDELLGYISDGPLKHQHAYFTANFHRCFLLYFCLVSRAGLYYCVSVWTLARGVVGQQIHCSCL